MISFSPIFPILFSWFFCHYFLPFQFIYVFCKWFFLYSSSAFHLRVLFLILGTNTHTQTHTLVFLYSLPYFLLSSLFSPVTHSSPTHTFPPFPFTASPSVRFNPFLLHRGTQVANPYHNRPIPAYSSPIAPLSTFLVRCSPFSRSSSQRHGPLTPYGLHSLPALLPLLSHRHCLLKSVRPLGTVFDTTLILVV